jgi:hypothetical protein
MKTMGQAIDEAIAKYLADPPKDTEVWYAEVKGSRFEYEDLWIVTLYTRKQNAHDRSAYYGKQTFPISKKRD